MPKFAANLTMLFTELPFYDRFKAARDAGFKAVEFLFPYDYTEDTVKHLLEDNGLEPVLFNLPAGDWAAGERGIAADPNRIEEFREGLLQAVAWAKVLGVRRLNCLAGKKAPSSTWVRQWQTLKDNVTYAAEVTANNGIDLLVEHLNHYDVPDFLLGTTLDVIKLLGQVNLPNVYLQYDIYHAQKVEGNLSITLRDQLSKIGHIQIADNPGRHQPGTGEINYPYLLGELDTLGYDGYVSLEYIPTIDTISSLKWIAQYGYSLD